MDIDKLELMLKAFTPQQLRERYAELYDHTPPTKNRVHLIRKILWAHQREIHGDISETTRTKALAIADDRDVKNRFTAKAPTPRAAISTPKTLAYDPGPNLLPGTVLHRKYKGRDIRLLVLENGFEWEGKVFKSLSAAAREITGTRWNGKLFFGLKKKGGQ